MRKVHRPESFEKFYYRNVGLGEGCGCAERIIDIRDHEQRAQNARFRRPSLLRRMVQSYWSRLTRGQGS